MDLHQKARLLCLVIFVPLVLSLVFYLIYSIAYENQARCPRRERALLWEGVKSKVCEDDEFVETYFNKEDSCCSLVKQKLCDPSYGQGNAGIELSAEDCSAHDEFAPFLKKCLPEIKSGDFFEIIRPMLTRYPYDCTVSGLEALSLRNKQRRRRG